MSDANPSRPRILVVDDSKVMRRALSKILGQDYDVVEAEHGEDGWTILLNDDQIQVVFTDLSMPYLDGYGLLARIRGAEDERVRALPVIVVTGKEDDDAAKQLALSKGASDFISKPFDSVQLKARAQAHAQHAQTTRKLSQTSADLEERTATDPLTGLGSKAYFGRAATESLAYARRHGTALTLLRLDVDDFNRLFIRHGKAAADRVLAELGAYLAGEMRQGDRVARIGLAKFAMLLQPTALGAARGVAERIRAHIAQMPQGDGVGPITVSIGLAAADLAGESSAEALLASADAALKAAAEAGGNRVQAAGVAVGTAPDLEAALRSLSAGDSEAVRPQAAALIGRALPLLELYARHVDAEAQPLVDRLKARLAN